MNDLSRLFEQAHEYLYRSDEILIVSPCPPDVDSIASCSLIAQYCEFMNIPCILYCAAPLPPGNSLFNFLPITSFVQTLPDPVPKHIVVVDYGSFATTKLDPSKLSESFIIGFDHHDEPARDFPINGLQIVNSDAPATTAVILHFMHETNTRPIVEGLKSQNFFTYVALGIYADTARLTNPKATPAAFDLMNSCIKNGIPWEQIRDAAKPKMSLSRMKAWSRAFEKVVDWFDEELGMAIFIYEGSYAQMFNQRHIEALLGPMQELEEANLAVLLLRQGDGNLRVSIRSKNPDIISAADIARSLGGGGHPHMAAALLPRVSSEETLWKIQDEVRKILHKQP